jgi:hypothetical protein
MRSVLSRDLAFMFVYVLMSVNIGSWVEVRWEKKRG